MSKLLAFIWIALLPGFSAGACDIYSLIQRGELQRARECLSDATTASLRDGNRLYFQSLLEPSAKRSVQLMEAALNTSVSPSFQEEIYYRLAQYYLLQAEPDRLGRLVGEYLSRWEAGKYRCDMLRMSVMVDELRRSHESALRQADRYLLEYSDGPAAQWGLIDKARLMFGHDKHIGALKLLRKLSREKSGPGVPQALYLLAADAVVRGRTDDAMFYYNLFREEFPSAVGLDAIVDRMAGMTTDDQSDAAAEKLTGTFYSIQVGVFSEPDNAKRQAETFSMYGQDVDIKKKVITDKEYRVVYVGRFDTYLDALTFKKMLEAKHDEVFQVVAR
ncbi:MAG: SPOR domain-containing protein [Candidatus Zixiibacteriota bacterium]